MPLGRREDAIVAVREELVVLSLQSELPEDDVNPGFAFRAKIYHPAEKKWREEWFFADEHNKSFTIWFTAK